MLSRSFNPARLIRPLPQAVLTSHRVLVLFFLLSTVYCLLSTPAAPAQQIPDRIQRGCGGLGGTLVRVLTDFDGSVRIITCTGGVVSINGVPITPGATIGGSGTANTLAMFTAATTIGNSLLTQTSTTSVNLLTGAFIYGGIAAPAVSAAGRGKFYFDSTSNTIKVSYNTSAFLDLARSNVTAGFVPLAAAGNVYGDSAISQTGANLTIAQTGGGDFGHLIGGVTYSRFIGATGQVRLGNQGISGTATILLNPANGRSDFGDTLTNQNGTLFRIDDSTQAYTFNQLITCGFLATNGAGVVGCGSGSPVTGSGTGGTLPIFLGGGTSLGDSFATQNNGINFDVSQGGGGAITLGIAAARFSANDTSGVVSIGDTTILQNGTRIDVNDNSQTIELRGGPAADVEVNGSTGLVTIGDFNGGGNSTKIEVSDAAQTVTIGGSASLVTTINSDSNIGLQSGAAQVQTLSGSGVVKIGDVASAGNSTLGTFNDTSKTITLNATTSAGFLNFYAGSRAGLIADAGSRTTKIGDVQGGGNSTTFTANDNAQTYVANKLITCGYLSTNGSGVFQCGSGTPSTGFSGTSASIGGALLAAGGCDSVTATVTGAASGMAVVVTPNTYPGDGNYWMGYVSAANTVTTKVCAAVAGTPTASTYNIRVIQ